MTMLITKVLNRFRQRKHKAEVLRAFENEFKTFERLSEAAGGRFPVPWEDRIIHLSDRTEKTDFDPHYTYHPAWAARVLAEEKPPKHVDIASTLQFIGIASAFIPMEFYDYRPADLLLTGLKVGSEDLTKLTFADASIRSLSCMHTIEHIGLGRYGDPLDPNGDHKAAEELKRVLAPGGLFLFVTPVGRSRICYNAHRVYGFAQALALFEGLTLERFSLLPDDYSKGMIENAPPSLVDSQQYGCGCFAFRKPGLLQPDLVNR